MTQRSELDLTKDNLQNLGEATAEMHAVLKVLAEEGRWVKAATGFYQWTGPGHPGKLAKLGLDQYKKLRRIT